MTALLVTACLVMAMALPVYAEGDLLPDAPGEVELLEDKQGTASGENTAQPEQNAATPEPEQSAEPEQPAPTETPEPTAEPTPTPEPAATATATPVPTVTPTATPEPTEQPQMMYAARSVDNVQAVSEGENTETHTLYFAVPKSWSDCTVVKIHAADGQDPKRDHFYFLEMREVSETKDHRKIYSAVLKKADHYKNGGLNGLEFCGYNGEPIEETKPARKIVIAEVGQQNPPWMTFNPADTNNYIGGDYYDPEAEGEKWSTYTVTVRHDDFAGKEMVFENKTSDETLTSVHAWFYEPDGNGGLNQVGAPIALNSIAPNSTATFKIPNELCSYVQFTWGEDNPPKSSKIYNFYGEDVSGVSGDDKESFRYSETSDCFIYTDADNVRWGIEKSFRIYYDATFSKLPTTGRDDTGGDYSIPKANQSTVYYRLKGDGKESIGGTMSRIEDTDYYAADVPDGYTKIVFSSYPLSDDEDLATCGNSTKWETIPENYKEKEQCFYADTNDDAVYSKGQRGGYWAPKDNTPRDAEKGKSTGTKVVDVVDIASVPFTEEANTKYVTSTLYDYYTDYELNGMNRDNYGGWTGVSHRTWVPFREFDQALSDYYQDANAQYPLYTGHFQPDSGTNFSDIAGTLNLFGYDNVNRFMAINNSQYNEDHEGNTHYDYAYQGLVANTTNADGAPLLNGTKTATVEPHFNKDFLLGENSKNAKLGEVYENVKFPFTKKENLFNDDTGVDYWCFDSKDTTLYLKQDSGQNSDSKYFLQSTNNRGSSENVNASSDKQGQYGYFPFNETATGGVASTYNYGFGTKLQMDFTLTDDGMVETNKIGEDNKKVKTNIKFFFSGDDDVWVFIDGKLALDVGGAHGKVSGLLEFGETEEKGKEKNSVTAYVSKVKTGGTPESNQNGSPAKTVKYNGEDINFYAQGTTLTFDKGQKHTLTMYYMERGMWESNMAVAFNFPDNNELQVQKKVDLSNVTDDEFKKCFTGQKIFNFTIQNQATHYGTTLAAKPDTGGIRSQVVDLTENGGNTFKPATEPTESNKGDYIFELADNPNPDPGNENEKVLHWYARYTDTEPVSYWRKQRYGILTLENPIDIEKMRFLTFQVYTDSKDDGGDLSLNNLYLELLDEQKVQKGSLGTTGINGATYGSVELETGKWVTVKLDLNKMKKQDGFDNKVKFIRVGDNYSRHIYFRNFTFIPKAVPSTMTGFTTDQKEIPDYHSVESGKLENAENAQYTSTIDNETQLVDGDGRFVLEAGETVTFSDQFRRGSYISLKEELNPKLYDTTWTVYENGEAVKSMNTGNHVTLGTSRPLDSQNSPAQEGPDDGRTEKKSTDATEQEGSGNIYNGQKPTTANTIVFRSYKNPDDTSSLTKLKVKYVNTVKTGGLKIQKEAAAGEKENIKGIYTFKVTFSNVGGAGLEEEDIIRYVEINMSDEVKYPDHTVTITGIPVGTRYTIEEVGSTDGAKLQSVTVPDSCKSAYVIKNNTMVEGVIKEANTYPITAIFTNTQRTLINIEFDKLWKDANNKDIVTTDQPDTIYIQLQRRLATSQNDEDWTPVNYPKVDSPKYVTIEYGESRWQFTFSGLDQYQINTDKSHTNYVYRIVEGTVKDGSFTPAAADGTITINGNTYVVTAKATPNSETNSAGSSTGNTATVTPDGTITGGSGKIELTNTLQNPKFVLDIIKKDAEKDEHNNDVFLKDVEFKLEKLVETTTGGEPQVDPNYKFSSNENKNYLTGITGADGKIIDNPFTNLEPGTYRLTETKAHPGYNLLAQPIEIQFTQGGECFIDGEKITDTKTFVQSGNTYTMTLTVLNRKTPELPHTGADAPSLWLLIGMPLAVAGLLIFTFRYNRKGGRRH